MPSFRTIAIAVVVATALVLPADAAAQTSSTPPATPQVADYGSRIKGLSERLEDIHSRLKRAGERIQGLRDYMVKNVNPNARLIVWFEDRMGGSFVPLSALVTLDGVQIASWSQGRTALRAGGRYEILNKEVPVGPKVLKVRARYRGAGGMPYMKDYAFKLNRTHTFSAKGGRITTVIAYGYQRGDATYDPSQRPWVGFDQSLVEHTQRNLRKVLPSPAKKEPAPAPPPPMRGVE